MGRGGQESTGTVALRSKADSGQDLGRILRKQENLLGIWTMRINRQMEGDPKDFADLIKQKMRGLRDLTYSPTDQRKLIHAARQAGEIIESLEGKDDPESGRLRARAERVDEQAREMFILCHRGYVERLITKHVHRFDSEDSETARDILRQACDIALHRTIDRYDFDNPANPLTYATRVMQDELKREAEAGRRIRLKSKANLVGDKVEETIKKIENEGRQASVAEISERLGESPERIAEILPHARRNMLRLDAPVPGGDGAWSSIGAMIEDPMQGVEDPVIEEDTRERLRDALDDLTPFERKAVEVAFGLGDNDTIEQKDLFDGVYLDKRGRAFSAKASVVADRERKGEKVTKKSQRELNELYKQGKLSFEPGNPEAHALARAAKGVDDETRSDRVLTYETGIPPTSGTVQEALRKGLEKLSHNQKLQGLDTRYRGDDELENSESARHIVRRRLASIGAATHDQLADLHSTRSPSGGKSKLRVLAEENNLVDPETGRISF